MRVLHVAYPFAPVSLDAAGGAEQIMAILDRALIARGHDSIAIACLGSRTAGDLLPVSIEASFGEASRRDVRRAVADRISEALDRWHIDIVHMHGVDFYEYLPHADVPVLATLHLPASFYPDSVFRLPRPVTYLNCVSESQLGTCPAVTNLLGAIENGIPLDLFPDGPSPRQDYALALGRICPEKGFHLAVEAAELAGIQLWIAGRVFPYEEHQRYFRDELLPRLPAPHRFLGPAGFARKVELLSRARCLLAPSLVAETSSLVAMEAIACGTPVICLPSGALAEVVEHGRTGFVARNTAEMAAAIARCAEINADECRRAARTRFSAERMADRYFELYERLAAA